MDCRVKDWEELNEQLDARKRRPWARTRSRGGGMAGLGIGCFRLLTDCVCLWLLAGSNGFDLRSGARAENPRTNKPVQSRADAGAQKVPGEAGRD